MFCFIKWIMYNEWSQKDVNEVDTYCSLTCHALILAQFDARRPLILRLGLALLCARGNTIGQYFLALLILVRTKLPLLVLIVIFIFWLVVVGIRIVFTRIRVVRLVIFGVVFCLGWVTERSTLASLRWAIRCEGCLDWTWIMHEIVGGQNLWLDGLSSLDLVRAQAS